MSGRHESTFKKAEAPGERSDTSRRLSLQGWFAIFDPKLNFPKPASVPHPSNYPYPRRERACDARCRIRRPGTGRGHSHEYPEVSKESQRRKAASLLHVNVSRQHVNLVKQIIPPFFFKHRQSSGRLQNQQRLCGSQEVSPVLAWWEGKAHVNFQLALLQFSYHRSDPTRAGP